MRGCLLCLQLKDGLVDVIAINCKQWNEMDIKNVLDKHMWPMVHIEMNSWICTTCWGELHAFHKFYMRIEEAHIDFGLTKYRAEVEKINSKKEATIDNEIAEYQGSVLESYQNTRSVEILGNEFLNENYLCDGSLKKDLISEEKPLVKFKIEKELLTDNNQLVQKRKRGRPRRDNCKSSNRAVTSLNKRKISKERKVMEICRNISNKEGIMNQIKSEEKAEENNAHIDSTERNFLSASENSHLSLENCNDSYNDTDGEYLDWNENKSDINTNYPTKVNHNEKDKFLAENFKITCFLCNIPFQTFFYMLKHFDEHHTERGHVKCCNKKFYRRSILVDHVHYHLNPNYFKCSQCGKVMADRRCLELHVEIHEGNHEKNHCCDICGKGFAKLGVLKKHRMIHLSEEEKRFSCSECGKNFASNYMLSSHYRSVHLKKYAKICDICGKSIRCKYVFERHMLQHEGKTVPSVNCDVCGLVLTDKKALKRHKDIIHPAGGQHEYTCSICSKTSPNLRAHKRHVQYKHLMGYDHKCTICDKAFKRAPTLREHMASHTGTILYTCPWCPKTFNSNANMHNHRKKVHPREWEEASRKRYSGNLPPNYKPPIITDPADFTLSLDI